MDAGTQQVLGPCSIQWVSAAEGSFALLTEQKGLLQRPIPLHPNLTTGTYSPTHSQFLSGCTRLLRLLPKAKIQL